MGEWGRTAALLAAVSRPSIVNLGREHLQPKQQLFYDTIKDIQTTFYGGAKGGGKSYGLRQILLMRRLEYPGSTGSLFRRTYKELEGNHIRPMFKQFPELRGYYNDSKKVLTLPNGSTLEFCHCDKEKDLGLYQGREFDDLGIDEAGQWPEGWFRTLQGSNRSSRAGTPARTLLTGNPGGIGHGWLKRLFVTKDYKPTERPEDHAFIQAFVQDNPALMKNDPGYIRKLEAEPNEALRRAYLLGDWDIFAGQFFGEISRNVHLIKNFQIPPHWNTFGAYDYGFIHPGVFGWFAVDEDGNVYLYRIYAKTRQRVDEFSRYLNQFEDTAKLYPIVAGHDCWAKRHHTVNAAEGPPPPTIAEEFAKNGINLKRANIDRVQGASQVRSYLAWQNRLDSAGRQINRPTFFIMESAVYAFDTLARMITDPDHPEDVLKVDAEEGNPESGDDAYDMVRYGLMSRPAITEPITPKIVKGSKEWHKKQNENLFDQAIEHFENESKKRGEGGWGGDDGGFSEF